jgi:hypothetical protein
MKTQGEIEAAVCEGIMAADSSYGTSVSSVPWISMVGGYSGVTLRTGQYGSSLARSVAGSKPVTSLVQSPFCRR